MIRLLIVIVMSFLASLTVATGANLSATPFYKPPPFGPPPGPGSDLIAEFVAGISGASVQCGNILQGDRSKDTRVNNFDRALVRSLNNTVLIDFIKNGKPIDEVVLGLSTSCFFYEVLTGRIDDPPFPNPHPGRVKNPFYHRTGNQYVCPLFNNDPNNPKSFCYFGSNIGGEKFSDSNVIEFAPITKLFSKALHASVFR